MSTAEAMDAVASLLKNVAEKHHEAFIDTDGEDPEWPIWYATELLDELAEILQADFTKSELTYLLVQLEKEQGLKAPGSDWATYWTRSLVSRYLG